MSNPFHFDTSDEAMNRFLGDGDRDLPEGNAGETLVMGDVIDIQALQEAGYSLPDLAVVILNAQTMLPFLEAQRRWTEGLNEARPGILNLLPETRLALTTEVSKLALALGLTVAENCQN